MNNNTLRRQLSNRFSIAQLRELLKLAREIVPKDIDSCLANLHLWEAFFKGTKHDLWLDEEDRECVEFSSNAKKFAPVLAIKKVQDWLKTQSNVYAIFVDGECVLRDSDEPLVIPPTISIPDLFLMTLPDTIVGLIFDGEDA